jgi:hypothetical protein
VNQQLKGESDPEWKARIDAERVTLAWMSLIAPPCSQETIESLPLFGGALQRGLFAE